MKKTRFLSAILAAAMVSPTFAETTYSWADGSPTLSVDGEDARAWVATDYDYYTVNTQYTTISSQTAGKQLLVLANNQPVGHVGWMFLTVDGTANFDATWFQKNRINIELYNKDTINRLGTIYACGGEVNFHNNEAVPGTVTEQTVANNFFLSLSDCAESQAYDKPFSHASLRIGSNTAANLTLSGSMTLVDTAHIALWKEKNVTFSGAIAGLDATRQNLSLTTGAGDGSANSSSTVNFTNSVTLGDLRLGQQVSKDSEGNLTYSTYNHKTITKMKSTAVADVNNLILGKADLTIEEGAQVKVNSGLTVASGVAFVNNGDLTLNLSGDSPSVSSDITGTGTITIGSELQYHSATWMDHFAGDVVLKGAVHVGNKDSKFDAAKTLTVATGGALRAWSTTEGSTFTRNLILAGGALNLDGASRNFSGEITLANGTTSEIANANNTLTLSGVVTGTGSLTKKNGGTLTIEGEGAKSFGSLKSEGGITNINAALTLSGSLESGSTTINVNKDVTAGNFASTGNGGRINIANGATLTVSDSSSGQGLWIDQSSGVTIASGSTLSIANGVLKLTASGTESATVARHNNGAIAKLGVVKNSDSKPVFLKNVMVTNGAVTYTGSGTLYLGSMQGGSLSSTGNIEFAGANSTIGSLTLNGNTITLGTEASHNHNLTITSSLAVTANSDMNANLIVGNGATMDFSNHTQLTMGCTVTIGDHVTIKIDDSELDNIVNTGATMTIINNVDDVDMANLQLTLGSGWKFVDAADHSLDAYNLRLDVVDAGNGKVNIVVAPEPATATLSLLALAALVSRRKRH